MTLAAGPAAALRHGSADGEASEAVASPGACSDTRGNCGRKEGRKDKEGDDDRPVTAAQRYLFDNHLDKLPPDVQRRYEELCALRGVRGSMKFKNIFRNKNWSSTKKHKEHDPPRTCKTS